MRFSLNKTMLVLLSVLGSLCCASAEGNVIMAPEESAIDNEWIIVLKDDGPSKPMQSLLDSNPHIQVMHLYNNSIHGFSARMTIDEAHELANDASVNYIQQNGIVQLDDIIEHAEVESWGLDRTDQRTLPLDSTFEPYSQGSGVTAYIADTGIFLDHNDFGGRAIFGVNYAGDGIDDDCNGHGTHVAGTVGGSAYGIAKDVELVAVKVLSCNGSGSWAGVIAGVDWIRGDAAGKKATANFSLGGSGSNQALFDAMNRLRESGVVPVVAAGNSDDNACDYSPAYIPSVITVGATTINDARSSFSNFGNCLDIFAPGSSIKAPWIDGRSATRTISGTSMASPHVCGVVALYLGRMYPPALIDNLLVDIGTKDEVTDPIGSPNVLLYVDSDVYPSAAPSSDDDVSFPTPFSNVPSGTPPSGDNEPLPLSWNITMIQAVAGSNDRGETMIEVEYESSNRDYDIQVYEEDCTTPTKALPVADERSDSDKKGFIKVDADVTIDQQDIKDGGLWVPDSDGTGGSFSFCLSKSLYWDNSLEDGVRATKKNVIFHVAVDNVADFSTNGITIETEEPEEEDVAINYKGTIEAYVCDENKDKVSVPEPLGPFDILNVCIEETGDDEVDVIGIQDLTLTQTGTRVSFLAIKDGDVPVAIEDLVVVDCNGSICMGRIQLISAFFVDIEPLTVEGKVTLGDSDSTRKLNVSAQRSMLRGQQVMDRSLQEDNDFKLQIDLAQPCKQGDIRSILSRLEW